MSFFNEAINHVFKEEGGFVDDPNDHGGATNYGITLHEWREFKKDPSLGPESIKEMSGNEAQEFYRSEYWTPLGLDLCDSKRCAIAILDQAVNRGKGQVGLEVQSVLHTLCYQIKQDGFIGPQTIGFLNDSLAIDPNRFYLDFIILSQLAYLKIALADQTQLKYLKGWLSRTHQLLLLQP